MPDYAHADCTGSAKAWNSSGGCKQAKPDLESNTRAQMTVESPMHYYQGNVLLDYAHPQGGQEGLAVAVLPQAEISLSDVSVVTSDDPSLVVACSAPPGYEYLLQTGGNSAPSKSESDNHLAV